MEIKAEVRQDPVFTQTLVSKMGVGDFIIPSLPPVSGHIWINVSKHCIRYPRGIQPREPLGVSCYPITPSRTLTLSPPIGPYSTPEQRLLFPELTLDQG